MKIGIDCHNLEGNRTGVGRYILNLLKEWSKLSGSDPDSLGVRPQSSQTRLRHIEFFLYFKKEIPEDVGGLTPHIRNLNVRSNAFFKHWVLPRAAERDGVDVLFCPDYVFPIYVRYRKLYIKTAITIHDIIYEARPSEYSWPSFVDKVLLKWASKRSAKRADIIFVPSEFTKKEILKYYNVNPQKVIVTPLAPDPIFRKLDFNLSGSDSNSDGVRPRHYWEGVRVKYDIRGNFIFFVGSIFNRRFLPQKIEAFENFSKLHSGFQFLIIGENHTSPYQDIRAMVNHTNNRLGRAAVIWQKYLDDDTELVYLYNQAYTTLWLSSYEGFGLPILESMACGTPVITSPRGSLSEVAGDAAFYIDNPENPDEISRALERLAGGGGYYNELVDKGFLQVKKFSWQRTAHETLKNLI